MPLLETNTFLDEDFLLKSEYARVLYHEFAKDQPIIDYHCHLPPEDIAANRKYDNLTEIWLDGDHYKWRAMRTLGVDEDLITGSATPREKFHAWAKSVPYTMRNPLYHWSHMELRRYFNIEELISEETADYIYDACSEQLQEEHFRVQSLLQRMNVEVICTTDDPTDQLEDHQRIDAKPFGITVLPAFRPDKALNIDSATYESYLEDLSSASQIEIRGYDSLCRALEKRMDYFHKLGCRLSDHGLEHIYSEIVSSSDATRIFSKYIDGQALTKLEVHQFKSTLLLHLCRTYAHKDWVQQFHLGALRNNNERMEKKLGPDTGFDSIGDFPQARSLSIFLNSLDSTNELAKTILYNLNPADNEVLATMIGNFNDGSSKGKMQFGSGWWYLDQKDGMENQMNTLSNMGLISCFVGMLTDSRSFLSYPRHEYFRRILCNLFGQDIQDGLLPADMPFIGGVIQDICYRNAKAYFNSFTD